jgi:superfamily II DNA or RNA helicase
MLRLLTLRDYQGETVLSILNDTDDYLVEEPPGAGKGVEIVTLAAMLCERRRVLVASPQVVIETSLCQPSYDEVILPDNSIVTCKGMVWPARGSGASSETIIAHLTQPGQNSQYALACTHAALARIDLSDLPESTISMTLIVDEAHHSAAVCLSQFVEGWRRRGGRVVMMTATGFRADGDPVVLAPHPITGRAMKIIRRTLAQHMEEGYAPAKVTSDIVAVRVSKVSADEFAGADVPDEHVQSLLTEQMIERWNQSKRPKVIVRVPVTPGGSSPMVQRVIEAFKGEGARVVDVTGDNGAAEETLALLGSERKLDDYRESLIDVIVGVQRVGEGLDWPLCSNVYCVGLPASLPLVIQIWGRAWRDKTKYANYPAKHKSESRITFFVPVGEPTEDLIAHHRRSTVLVCAYLETGPQAEEWAVVKAVGRGVICPLTSRPATAITEYVKAYPRVDPLFRAEALAMFATIREDLINDNGTAPDVEILSRACNRLPQLPASVLRQVMIEFILAQNEPANATARERIRQNLINEITEAKKTRKELCHAFQAAFDQIVIDLDSAAIVISEEMGNISRHIISLTGENIREIGYRLSAARPLSSLWLAEVVATWKNRYGRYPKGDTPGHPQGWPQESWNGIDRAMASGERQWPLAGVRSLAAFCSMYAARGSVADLLDEFERKITLTPVEKVLLDSLCEQRINVRDTDTTFGLAPAPKVKTNKLDSLWWVLDAWWFYCLRGKPLLDVHGLVFLINLKSWLRKTHGYELSTGDGPVEHVHDRYGGLRLLLRSDSFPTGTTLVAAGVRFPAGCVFAANATATLLEVAKSAGLKRVDGGDLVRRKDFGYVDAEISVRVYLDGTGKPSFDTTARLSDPVAVPVAWVTVVEGEQVPSVWRGTVQNSGRALTLHDANNSLKGPPG